MQVGTGQLYIGAAGLHATFTNKVSFVLISCQSYQFEQRQIPFVEFKKLTLLNMSKGLVASASIQINAPVEIVWDALTNPGIIKKYMFGTEVITDWKEGSPVLWKGMWEGKTYEDKGVIIKKIPLKTLEVTHFSPLSGLPDTEENYHTLIYNLSSSGKETILNLTQDNNHDENSRNHSENNWVMMLQNLKNTIEKK